MSLFITDESHTTQVGKPYITANNTNQVIIQL